MQTPTDLDPPKRFYHLTLIIAISGWFERRSLINFTIMSNEENSVMVCRYHIPPFEIPSGYLGVSSKPPDPEKNLN